MGQRAGLVVAFAGVRVDGDGGNEDITIDVSLEHGSGIAHPHGQAGRIINDHIPLAALEGVELAIAVAQQLFHFVRQFAGMRLAAIKNRYLVASTQGISYLERAGKTGPPEDKNAQGFARFFAGRAQETGWPCSQCEGGTGGSR